MNYMITIARETIGLTGYRTFEKIETVPRDEGLRKLSGMNIKRRFPDSFNSSIEIVVVE